MELYAPSSTQILYSNYIIFCSKLSMYYCTKIRMKTSCILCNFLSGFRGILQFSQMEMRFLRKNKKSKAETYFLKTYVLFMKMVTKKSGQHLLSAPVL